MPRVPGLLELRRGVAALLELLELVLEVLELLELVRDVLVVVPELGGGVSLFAWRSAARRRRSCA
jgi:hypothetical protein